MNVKNAVTYENRTGSKMQHYQHPSSKDEALAQAHDHIKKLQAVVDAASEAANLLRDGETTMAAVCLEDALRALDGKENTK